MSKHWHMNLLALINSLSSDRSGCWWGAALELNKCKIDEYNTRKRYITPAIATVVASGDSVFTCGTRIPKKNRIATVPGAQKGHQETAACIRTYPKSKMMALRLASKSILPLQTFTLGLSLCRRPPPSLKCNQPLSHSSVSEAAAQLAKLPD